MKYLNRLPLAAIALLCSLLITSCKKDHNPPKVFPTVQLQTHAELGNYLADSLGYTLYYFSNLLRTRFCHSLQMVDSYTTMLSSAAKILKG